MTLRLLFCALFLHGAACAADADALPAVRRALIQGDVRTALSLLPDAPVAQWPAKDAAMAQCLPGRFAPPAAPAAGADALGKVLAAYRRYWNAVLLQGDKAQAEAALLAELAPLLPDDARHPWNRRDVGETVMAVRAWLEGQGLHVITGITHPYFEFMAWRTERPQRFEVALPERRIGVPVVFMGDFVSRGWLSYASCERYGAGGWTAGGTVYVLQDDTDPAAEPFRVSRLGHAGQHLADNQDYPKLEQSELEYRAKLAEIVLSRETTRKLVTQFMQQGQQGRRAPHAHAEYWLARRLREQLGAQDWQAADDAALRTAARTLLVRSSAQARVNGAATVTRLLPD